jgi:hypothetical protein
VKNKQIAPNGCLALDAISDKNQVNLKPADICMV